MAELNANSLVNDANLQGYWRLEADGTDSSPNGYDLTENASPTYVTGKFGNGVDLESGSSQYLSIEDASCPNLEISGSQTWGAWIKPEVVGDGKILSKNYDNSAYRILSMGADDKITCYVSGLTTNTSVKNDTIISAGNWYFVCFVYDSVNELLKIWVDGNKDEVAASGSATDTNGDFSIGRDGGRDLGYFDGIIDDAFVFNRALTDNEVLSLYTGISTSPSASPSASPSVSPSASPSTSPSQSPSSSRSPSVSVSSSPSLSPSSSPSASPSASISPSSSPSASPSASISPSSSPSASLSASPSASPSISISSSPSISISVSPSVSPSIGAIIPHAYISQIKPNIKINSIIPRIKI